MARHTDVVSSSRHRSRRRLVEARAARRAELLALAIAGLAGSLLHGDLPALERAHHGRPRPRQPRTAPTS